MMCNTLLSGTLVPSQLVPSLCAMATCAAPTPALGSFLASGTTRHAPIDALAAVTPGASRLRDPRATRVCALEASLVALFVAPIPPSPSRIRRLLLNTSNFGSIAVCLRRLVFSPPCFT